MRIYVTAFSLVSSVSFSALAVDWQFRYQPADVSYTTYGNSLGDPNAPKKDDRKIAFEIRGRAAREIFEAIGPDRRDVCTEAPGLRMRSRDEERLVCTKRGDGKYACYFGFDLKSGKSIGGSIC